MSLIPSESLSFPDDFSRSISRARVQHEMQRYVRRKKSKIAPPPENPERPGAARPVEVAKVPALSNEPPPAPKPEWKAPIEAPSAPRESPPRPVIARTPILGRSAGRAIPLKINTRQPRVKSVAPPRVAKPNGIGNKIVDLAPSAPPSPAPLVNAAAPAIALPNELPGIHVAPAIPRRRRKKFSRLLKIEVPALFVLLVCAIVGFTHYIVDPTAKIILNGVTIAAACVAAITPIALFARTPTLPPIER